MIQNKDDGAFGRYVLPTNDLDLPKIDAKRKSKESDDEFTSQKEGSPRMNMR